MPRTINPRRKRIVKRELKKGESARTALKQANYSPGAIRKSTANKVVKVSIAEITREFDKSKITVEYILEEFEKAKELCLEANDRTNLLRVLESLGRHLAMFTDKTETKDVSKDAYWDEFQQSRGNRVKELVDNSE